MEYRSLRALAWALLGAPVMAAAQVPDLVSAFEAGGAALGMGSAGTVLGADTFSGYFNPAGLGYVTRTQVGLSLRNLPKSQTTAYGNLSPAGAERLDTNSDRGPTGVTHIGVAVPLKAKNGGTNGTISVALTTGGYVSDTRVAGSGLMEGGLPAPGYTQQLYNRTQFLTVAYGRSTQNGSLNWGAGLVYAMNRQGLQRSAPSGTTNYDEDATGLGAIVGVQYTPPSSPDFSAGLSYRTPIQLNGGGGALLFDEIPGRLSAGAAWRYNGMRSGRDYAVFAAQVDHYFSGGGGLYFGRDEQTVVGLGVEYNYALGAGRIPLRLGYRAVPGAGTGYGDRNAFSFGLGFRPGNDDWGLDVGFSRPFSGGSDMNLSMFYRLGN